MSVYLVTGGAGFIGSNIVKYLVAKDGVEVRVLDDLSSGKEKNLHDIKDQIDFIQGDIKDKECAKKAVSGVDYILHLAAVPSVPRSVAEPVLTNEANINGTLNMLIAAKDEGVKRFVFSSSSSLYGDAPVMPKVETMLPMPISPYAVQKITGEYYCSVFYKLFGLKTISLRYFNVFGPSQDPESEYAAVIPKFITMILEGKNPTIFGDGEQSRDFTYVENIIKANVMMCEKELDGCYGEAFNVACNQSISLNDLVKDMNKILGKNIEPVYLDERQGDVKHSLAGIDKVRDKTGYVPAITVNEGLKMTIDWYVKKNG